MRRKSVIGYFSAANIKKLEPTIKEYTKRLCERFRKQSESGEAINLSDTFNRMTGVSSCGMLRDNGLLLT